MKRSGAGAAAVAVQWAQCDNPNCQKWRRLPPGAGAPDEDAPWYCFMNPDPDYNTCSADEAVGTWQGLDTCGRAPQVEDRHALMDPFVARLHFTLPNPASAGVR